MLPNRLEQYLDQLERPLAALPPEARREWREEARQHLAHLIAAHEELGAPPEAAVEAALRQFGDPTRISKNLRASTLKRARAAPDWEVARPLAAMFWNVGMFGALMRLPGAFDHLPAVGVGLGMAYWAAGAVLGRALKSVSPRPAALLTLWTGCYTLIPYLWLLVLLGPATFPAALGFSGAALGGIAALGGLFLGARSAAATRRARGAAPASSLPSGSGQLPA